MSLCIACESGPGDGHPATSSLQVFHASGMPRWTGNFVSSDRKPARSNDQPQGRDTVLRQGILWGWEQYHTCTVHNTQRPQRSPRWEINKWLTYGFTVLNLKGTTITLAADTCSNSRFGDFRKCRVQCPSTQTANGREKERLNSSNSLA